MSNTKRNQQVQNDKPAEASLGKWGFTFRLPNGSMPMAGDKPIYSTSARGVNRLAAEIKARESVSVRGMVAVDSLTMTGCMAEDATALEIDARAIKGRDR
jgi:hypothetical protein